MSLEDNAAYQLRKLTLDDVPDYRRLRLEALRLHPGFFMRSYEQECTLSPEDWELRITDGDRCTFGLFFEMELVGITAIIAEGEKGYLTQTYLRAEHRGRHLSRWFYEARIAWARERGLSFLEVAHRASNIVSGAANQHYGFCFSYAVPQQWPDGGAEEMLYYRLEL